MSAKRRKNVTEAPKSFRGEFSFVNKDATNIDSKDHNAAVSWHVMNRYERWKRQEDAKKLRASANLPRSPLPSTSGPASPEEEAIFPQYPPSPWRIESIEQSVLDSPGPSSPTVGSHPWFTGDNTGDLSYALDPQILTEDVGSSSQEIPQIESGYPPLVARILSHAYGYIIPVTWPNESSKSRWTFEISQTWDDIALIKQDSCYASALLCFYATLMATTTNDKDITSQACFFQVQAMTELRERLAAQPPSQSHLTLKAILKLFSAETALDNTSAARVHLKMLRNFVVAQGGLVMLEPWFRENLLSADCYFALKYETRPLFPASEWSPGPLSQPWVSRLAQAGTPEDHSTKIDQCIEHPNLRNIITDLRELFRVQRYLNTHSVPADDQLLRWRHLRRLDCLSRLAEHQLTAKIYPHLLSKPKLQLAICGTITLLTGMVLGSPEPSRSGLKLLVDLCHKNADVRAEIQEARNQNQDDVVVDASRISLWMLYVGALAEQVHPVEEHISRVQETFKARLKEARMSVTNFNHSVSRHILWSSTLQEEIGNGRAYRHQELRKGIYEACGMSWREPVELMGKDHAVN